MSATRNAGTKGHVLPPMIDAHHHLWDLAAREHRWLMGGQPWATDAELAAAGLSFDVVTLPHQLPAAVTAARSVPELTFVLDHLGGPPAGSGHGARTGPWADAVRGLAALPNVACKLSGMHTSTARAGD